MVGREGTDVVEKNERGCNSDKFFYQVAVGQIGFPGAEIARYLGVTTTSVNRLTGSEKAADLRKYLKML